MRHAILTILCCGALAASGCAPERESAAPIATVADPTSPTLRVSTPPSTSAPGSTTGVSTTTTAPVETTTTTTPPTTTPPTTTTMPAGTTTSTTAPTEPAPATLAPAPPPRAGPPHVLVAGDSTGSDLAVGMAEYEDAHPREIRVSHSAFAGCGLTARDDGRLHAWNVGPEWIDLSGCTTQWNSIPQRVVTDSIDVVVVCIGPWDAGLIGFPDGSTVSVLDPAGRELVVDAYAAFVTAVSAAGAVPVFVRPPTIDVEWERRADVLDDPARWEEMRAIVDSLGVAQIDLPAFLAAHDLEGPAGRPDGIHLAPDVRARFVAEAVVPQVLALGA